MSDSYKHNHYVPEWYQKKFIPQGQQNQELYYLDLNPEIFRDSRGVEHKKSGLKHTGVKQCFAEDDLYTANFFGYDPKIIEKIFFGEIDTKGKLAVDFFDKFDHTQISHEMFDSFMNYLCTQKLRTPKGLDWLSKTFNISDKDQLLSIMMKLRRLYAAIWTECVWLIADASNSNTKFIISDHPLTVYNKACGPQWTRRNGDPKIELQGTHTLFPLSENKILILTNLSWVRNPYQSPKNIRPNPSSFRGALFNYTNIQVQRFLTEEEVRQINFIIKSMAYRYIAAGKENWLHPEDFVSKSNWNGYGNGYLLMPDPRPINIGGEILMGFQDGSVEAFDSYGRKPWDPQYNSEFTDKKEFDSLYKFKGEFAKLYGPKRRGRSFHGYRWDPEEDSTELHQHHLSYCQN